MPVTQVVRLFAPGAIHRLATPDPTAASSAARFLLRHAGMGIVP